MSLAKRLALLLLAASLAGGFAWTYWQHQMLVDARLKEESRTLADAEEALNRLARDLRRYEEARAHVGAEAGFARHEKVALSARLSPAELARIEEILRRAYADEGFLLLRSFSLGWSGERELSLQLNGEKVFVR